MRKNSEQTLGWLPRIMSLTTVAEGILFLGLLYNPVQGFGVPGPAYSVTLAWDQSPSTAVTGYRVYYGAASGNYTNSLLVGNVTTITVPGLALGVTYFLAIKACNTNGLESAFSNEISFVPGLPTVQLRMATNRQAVLTVKGQIGANYDILASQTFSGWTVIGNITLGAVGWLDFTDTNAASFPKRFYRTKKKS